MMGHTVIPRESSTEEAGLVEARHDLDGSLEDKADVEGECEQLSTRCVHGVSLCGSDV